MMSDKPLSEFSILFVDDEEKTRKMFARLISPYYSVLLAEDVPSAIKQLEKNTDTIGVLLTDQRMPGALGVELLRHVRSEYPNMIRLLTTAYSDLEDAIEAVNTGEIFRYINKPWNIDELLIDLKLAMNFYHLQQDRQQLINEKMSIGNKQAKISLLKSLLSFASAQISLPNARPAMASVLHQIGVAQGHIDNANLQSDIGYWDGEVAQTINLIALNQAAAELLSQHDAAGDTSTTAAELTSALAQLDSPLRLKADDIMLPNSLSAKSLAAIISQLAPLFSQESHASGDLPGELLGDKLSLSLHVNKAGQKQGITISIRCSQTSHYLATLFASAMAEDAEQSRQDIAGLIASTLMLASHGGQVDLQFNEASLSEINLFIPSASLDKNASPEAYWLEDLFVLYG